MRRNKESLSITDFKKILHPISNPKAACKVLKKYNSCLHQKVLNKKDMSSGQTIYISSIQKHELPKTLQAYYSLGLFSYAFESSQFIKNHGTNDINETSFNKNKKYRCEGICGKIYHFSRIKPFFHDNKTKNLCLSCIDQILIGSS